MTKLIDREYPFGTEAKEFRLVMRALRSGWVVGEAASELIDQALVRVSNHSNLRESISLLRTAVAIERKELKLYHAKSMAILQQQKQALREAREGIARKCGCVPATGQLDQ